MLGTGGSESGTVFHYLLEISVTLILKGPLSLFHIVCCVPAPFPCVLRTLWWYLYVNYIALVYL